MFLIKKSKYYIVLNMTKYFAICQTLATLWLSYLGDKKEKKIDKNKHFKTVNVLSIPFILRETKYQSVELLKMISIYF